VARHRSERDDPTEDHFRALVRHSSDLLAVIDTDARLLRPTPNGALGYPQGALVGRNTFELVHPDDLAAAQHSLRTAVEHPDVPVRSELRVRHANGEWRCFEVAMTNFLADPAVRGVVVNGHDVTGRKEFERALADREHFSRSVIESLTGSVLVLDGAGIIVRTNHGWDEFVADCGGDPSTMGLGANYLVLCDLARDHGFVDSAKVAAGIRAVLDGRLGLFRVEYRAPTVEEERWYVLRAAPLTTESGGCVIHQVDITERKRYETQLAEAALRDALTGLPNRALLADRLKLALERGRHRPEGVGVLFIDVDHFKVLNDGRGHTAGDRLLVTLAARLSAFARPGDTVARFGGDEFVMLCERLESPHQLQAVAERIVSQLAEPFLLDDGEEAAATVSIGIALSTPDSTTDSLLRDADAAMYQAKDRGRNRFSFFDDSLRLRALTRLRTENDLRHALERGEMRVWYQPIVRIVDGQILGAEALLRWEHPERGFVYPDEFIAVSEETGLVNPIGAWVLREACTQAYRWVQRSGSRQFGIAVNLSARQLARPEIVDEVSAAMSVSGLSSEHLTLELTETSLIDPRHAPSAILHALRRLGVRLSLDDFGTGFSSLSYLKRFPIQAIKIDRSFVEGLGRDPDDAAIVTATIAIARSLSLSLIAEGIETEAQRDELVRLGCEYGQGYLYSRPVSADAFDALLDAQSSRHRRTLTT
jgi:diguanylate cyclase (GGDEF)-like protein/PAS domain S-box-containing protein